MRRLSVIVTVVALLLNVMSASNSYAFTQDNGNVQVLKVADEFVGDSLSIVNCSQCSSCHHHCGQTFLSQASSYKFSVSSIETYSGNKSTNYSQFSYPLSKPPKV